MAWSPTTGAGSLASGYLSQGVTTARWGTKTAVTTINGTSVNGTSVGVVLRFNQKNIVDNIKLPNGDGLTVTRVQIVDGVAWDVTIRDDTNIATRPVIGSTVVIADGGGMLGNTFKYYSATVTESAFDTAPKQPGEMVFTCENLVLVESQTGA